MENGLDYGNRFLRGSPYNGSLFTADDKNNKNQASKGLILNNVCDDQYRNRFVGGIWNCPPRFSRYDREHCRFVFQHSRFSFDLKNQIMASAK